VTGSPWRWPAADVAPQSNSATGAHVTCGISTCSRASGGMVYRSAAQVSVGSTTRRRDKRQHVHTLLVSGDREIWQPDLVGVPVAVLSHGDHGRQHLRYAGDVVHLPGRGWSSWPLASSVLAGASDGVYCRYWTKGVSR
jgi:hypothetical protein